MEATISSDASERNKNYMAEVRIIHNNIHENIEFHYRIVKSCKWFKMWNLATLQLLTAGDDSTSIADLLNIQHTKNSFDTQ